MAIKIGQTEIDDTKISDPATRASIIAIATAIAEGGTASATAIAELAKKIDSGVKPEAIAELVKKIDELGKNPPTPPKKDDPKPGDPTEALLAKFTELLKPITEKVTAIETERTQAQKAAATKGAVEAYLAKTYPNLRVKGKLAERLIRDLASAEKIDDALLAKQATEILGEYAAVAGAKDVAAFVGSNAAKGAEGGGGDSKADAEAAAAEKLASLRKLNAGEGTSGLRPALANTRI